MTESEEMALWRSSVGMEGPDAQKQGQDKKHMLFVQKSSTEKTVTTRV